jgi:hypothetical protein
MTLIRGGLKVAAGLTGLYLVFWRPLHTYTQWYNDMYVPLALQTNSHVSEFTYYPFPMRTGSWSG